MIKNPSLPVRIGGPVTKTRLASPKAGNQESPVLDSFQSSDPGAHSAPTALDAVLAARQLLQPQAKAQPTVDIGKVKEQISEGLPDVDVEYLHTDKFGELNGRLASMEELETMMASFADESGIPFGYIRDGCYARAHMMDESFRQHGINIHKMFCRGDLAAENDHMSARWWYHVAPLVFVDDGKGEAVAKVIDPGFSSKPMDPEEWVSAMNQGPRVQIDLVGPEQYYPRRNRKPDTFAESLPPATSTLKDYSKKLHRHREKNGENLGDYVEPSWKDPGSGGDFVLNGETKTVYPEGVQEERNGYFVKSAADGALIKDALAERNVSAAWENRPLDFDPYAKP